MSPDWIKPAIRKTTGPIIKIHVSAIRSHEPVNDRRAWDVHIKQMVADQAEPERDELIKIEDPFTISDYDDYEKSKQFKAGPPGLYRERSNISERSISIRSLSELREYRQKLRAELRLDQIKQENSVVKISISEDLHPEDQEDQQNCSIHGLLWELLEQDDTGKDIQVTRWITGIRALRDLPAGLCYAHEPIRLLLVIARSLQRSEDGTFRDTKNVVYDTLYSMAHYLRKHGRHERLAFDVVRPGTWKELGSHLKRGRWDMVHFDVHGWVETNGVPQLLFAQPNAYRAPRTNSRLPDNQLFEYVEARKIAELLGDNHIKAVALSACLSSYNQRKPPSNMCRVFARYGVCAVTGMNFSVEQSTAEAYYAGFYAALVISNRNFRSAAAHGRKKLQVRLRELDADDERSREEDREMERLELPPHRRNRSASVSSNVSNISNVAVLTEDDSPGHDGWPMATTYFMTDNLERTNSAKLGIDWYMSETYEITAAEFAPVNNHVLTSPWLHSQFVPWLFEFVKTELFAFITLTISIILHIVFHKSLKPCCTALTVADLEEAALTSFPAFRETDTKRFKHSTGLMALEDRLKDLKQLYIQIYPYSDGPNLNGLRDLWLTTNFADIVEIVPASRFKHQWYHMYWFHLVRHILLGYLSTIRYWLKRMQSGSSLTEEDPPSRSILIIYEFESIFKKQPKYWWVLDRMTAYIRAVEARHPSGLYLIIMSSTEVGWMKYQWNPDQHPWTLAQSFFARPEFSTMNSRS